MMLCVLVVPALLVLSFASAHAQLRGHGGPVRALAITPDGRALATAGYDATLRVSLLAGSDSPVVTTLPTPLNTVAVAPDGEIVTAGADGKVYFLSGAGELKGE